jgi:outer membrane protein
MGLKRLSWLVMMALSCSPAMGADLLQTYSEAQQQDAAFASARAAYQAGQEKLPQGRALLLPSINLSANTTHNDTNTQYRSTSIFSSGSHTYNSNGYTVSLDQPVYNKPNMALYEESKYQVTQAEATLASAQQDLIVRVAQAYFDVLLAEDNIALAEAQKKAIAEQLAQAERNFEVGTATITDTRDAQARYDLVVSQESAARNDLEVKRQALQQIIGKTPAELLPLKGEVPLLTPDPDNMDEWVKTAEKNNPQLNLQRAALEIANQEVERNRGGHYPTLNLVAAYSSTGQSGSSTGTGSDSTNKTVGLQLNLPLYQGGSISSKTREAVANQEKARQDLELTDRQVGYQTRQAFLGVTSGIAQVKALEQALVSSQSSLDATILGRDVGVRTSVDVLNSQQQYYSAKRDLSQARYNYILSRLKLKSAAGTLLGDDLKQVNGWLGKPASTK